MELKIQSVHFDATQKLQEFIQKKMAKIEKAGEQVHTAEVVLKVVKPETALNKETAIHLGVPGDELFATKTCNTFEEGVDTCIDALLKQLSKYKEKKAKR